ncbi:hypothetical protein CY0110_19462 [Crocosphaera chwakensis CCY0110]|uniref:Uncharacterized protein n=1 Tax=Crocosphaera chwakensis CCY0110 TaxID=391612 RepID=A3IJM4_9CHRO|nr:hypothetical protein CY0110_19462 [Crocosphaera chwakensis CCY0110]
MAKDVFDHFGSGFDILSVFDH